MLIVMEAGARPEQIEAVVRHIEKMGLKAHPIPGAQRTAIGVTGRQGAKDPGFVENFPGVKEVIHVSHSYKLVSREAKPDDSIISVGGVDVGGNGIIVVGGPCAVESYDQTRTIAESIKRAGAQLFRGGAYKPRTSPYEFQGLGKEGLALLNGTQASTALAIHAAQRLRRVFDAAVAVGAMTSMPQRVRIRRSTIASMQCEASVASAKWRGATASGWPAANCGARTSIATACRTRTACAASLR